MLIYSYGIVSAPLYGCSGSTSLVTLHAPQVNKHGDMSAKVLQQYSEMVFSVPRFLFTSVAISKGLVSWIYWKMPLLCICDSWNEIAHTQTHTQLAFPQQQGSSLWFEFKQENRNREGCVSLGFLLLSQHRADEWLQCGLRVESSHGVFLVPHKHKHTHTGKDKDTQFCTHTCKCTHDTHFNIIFAEDITEHTNLFFCISVQLLTRSQPVTMGTQGQINIVEFMAYSNSFGIAS